MKTTCVFLAMLFSAGAAAPGFNGTWRLLGASGANAPADFIVSVRQSSGMLQFDARWEEPKNGQYALTLLGVVTPLLRLSTAGQEDLNQVGPFVFHSRSRWEGDRLITEWSTSAFMDQSFRGTWTRALSADGRQFTLEIAATSSAGKNSRATLIFRRE